MLSRFVERRRELEGIYSVYFTKPAGFDFTAGDYTEIELDYPPRGGRRWFSLSSAPSDEHLRITFRRPEPHSRFKHQLMSLQPGDELQVAPAMGNFNLPPSPRPVLLVAIGIGLTPYCSIISELNKSQQLAKWDIKLLQAGGQTHALFDEVLAPLGQNRLKIPARPILNPTRIATDIPDMDQRLIFLAGPEVITAKLHAQLSAGLPASQLRLSYFPGYKRRDAAN